MPANSIGLSLIPDHVKVNILFLSGQYPPHSKGGGEISTSLIAEGLHARGLSVRVITNQELPGLIAKPLLERRHAKGLALVLARQEKQSTRDALWHAHDFRSGLVLYELLRGGILRPEQVYITLRDYAAISGDTNNLLSTGSIPKNPMSLKSSWGSYRIKEATFPRNIARFWQYTFNVSYRSRALLSLPNQIYISKAQRAIIDPYIPPTRYPVRAATIYNPVAAEYFVTREVNKNPLRVLYVGRIESYKGVGLLLDAWRRVVTHIPDAQLRLIGAGAQRDEYMKAVNVWDRRGSVTFVDHVPYEQVLREYDAAEVIVSPHLWAEPFGRSVVEAMARARIVVAANSGGPSEIIRDGVTGIEFATGSVESLTQALEAALTMPSESRKKIGEAARSWVQQHLAPEIIAKQYKKFYNI